MIFASWTFDGLFLDINVNSNEGDITNYIKNGEWHLVKLLAIKNLKKYSCCEEPYPEIIYKLVIRRRPLYYLFNMVFPCFLITMVAFLGFYLPPGSTEKVSIGITTLLSITVFLMMVAESMPPTSEQLPLLSIYYAVTIWIVLASTAFSVYTLHINSKGDSYIKVPKIVKKFFIDILGKILRTKLSESQKLKSLENSQEYIYINKKRLVCYRNENDTFFENLKCVLNNQFNSLIKKILDVIEMNEKHLEETQRLEDIQNEWSNVAKVADHFLCYFFPITTIAICLLIFLNSPHAFTQW